MTILSAMIDSREPEWVQRLTFGNVPCSVVALDSGDVWAATSDAAMLVIERKTPSDLLGSIKDGRLFDQAARMKAASPWAYVIITGTLYAGRGGRVVVEGRETGWDYNAVQGALLTIQELGVHVLSCASDAEFESSVLRLANRERGVVTIEPQRLTNVLGPGEAALAALPGVGIERLKALLDHCQGSPAWALSWLTWDYVAHGDGAVTGIGPGTKRAVRRALGLTDEFELSVVSRENGQIAKQEGK